MWLLITVKRDVSQALRSGSIATGLQGRYLVSVCMFAPLLAAAILRDLSDNRMRLVLFGMGSGLQVSRDCFGKETEK